MRQFWISKAVAAFAIVIVTDLALRSLVPGTILEKYEPRESTLLADLVRAWKSAPQAPGLCFLGSSLMQCALRNSAPTFLSQAVVPEEPQASTFSWALGGENASDSYAIASSMMTKTKKPKLLIYGIAPRDLLDNNVKSPVGTDIFRYLSTPQSIASLPPAFFASLDDQVSCYLKQVSFVVDRKNVFSKIFAERYLALVSNMVSVKQNAPTEQQKIVEANKLIQHPNTNEQSMLKKQAAFKLLQDVSKGVTIFRYNPYCQERYDRQVAFLNMLLAHLDDIGTEVVLVKMPLKKEHVEIMPKVLFDSYNRDIDRLATKYGAALLDFNTSEFKDSDYGDVAHLNPNGAKVFQDKLVKAFREPVYRDKLAASGRSFVPHY